MEYRDNILGGNETAHGEGSKAPTAAEDDLIGIHLDGRYLIERKLGQGSFGTVYLASDKKMVSKKVVVKVMRDEKTESEWSAKKFKQEIEALTLINHPGVVGVFDSGETPDGKPYIVMQYVDGVSLRSLITPEGMQFGRVANIISQIGRALSAAHLAGILHRDLKPENVMLERLNEDDEHVKIIDFGVAKVKNSVILLSTAKDQAVGTIVYMSPEQLSTQPLTPASDIYSLGVVAYEMLTGRRPTNPESAFQLLDLQRSGVRIKPTDLRPNLPQTAESILLKALSFEPKDRFASAREFGDLLSNALLGDDEQADVKTKTYPERYPSELPALERERHEGARTTPPLEPAHVLFMDIVRYTTLLIEEMSDLLEELNEIVRNTQEFKIAELAGELLPLPTGDGMALSFFGDLESPVRCAAEISKALREHPEIKLRMGVHSGLVRRIKVITKDLNIAGPGINFAQRVMDCGDAGHILLSKRVADDLRKVSRWAKDLHDLGEAKDKHGEHVHVFNLYNEEIGNSEVPVKLRQPEPKPRPMKRWLMVVAALIVIAGGLLWAQSLRRVQPTTKNSVTIPNPSLERGFTYFLIPSDKGKIAEEERFAGNEQFHNGSKFTFVLIPEQSGALYLLDKGSGAGGNAALNVLFPTPKNNNGSSAVASKQRLEVGIHFDRYSGDENLFIIWTSQPVSELETIFKDAAGTDWEIKNPAQLETITAFLNKYQSSAPKVEVDSDRKQTTVRGRGETMISTRVLKHRDF